MKIRKRILFCLTGFFFLFIGCTNLITDPPSDANSNTTIEIFSPVNGDSVGVGVTEIDYLISTSTSLKFMELYVNGSFIKNYSRNSDDTQPRIYLQLNESSIETSIDYYNKVLKIKGSEEFYFWGNTVLNLGHIYSSSGAYSKAREYYERALKYKGESYQNSIRTEAKAGLKKISNL